MSATHELPLVSCLMITDERLDLARRSIRCFTDQTYPRRELVVVSAGDETYRGALEDHLSWAGISSARVVAAAPGSTIGRLRNLSLDAASGDIVCQWDDDDCYHPDRILRQVEQMTRQGARACFLTEHLHLLESDRQLFWDDWTWGSKPDQWFRLFPPSVMMVKDARFRYPETGPSAHLGEDLELAANLCRAAPVATLDGMGWLYLYVYHGGNTCSKEHHYRIAARRSFSNEQVAARSDEIRRAMEHFATPRPITVCGTEGPVFSLP